MKNIRSFSLIYVFIGSLFFLSSYSGAQELSDSLKQVIEDGYFTDSTQSPLQAIGKYYGDSIVLRWAPTSGGTWLDANRYGYQVKRLEIDTNKDIDPAFYQSLHEKPILPYELARWKELFDQDTTNNYLLVGAECLYSEWETLKLPEGPQTWIARQDELSNRWSSLLLAAERDPTTAEAAGLRFVDKDVMPNKLYLYHISVDFPDSLGENIACYLHISTNKIDKTFQPEIAKVEEKEEAVVLFWDRTKHESQFSSYFIERSADGGSTFERLNTVPYIQAIAEQRELYSPYIIFRDSVENYKPYLYRIVGLTSFGEQSPASESISGMGRDKTPPTPPTQVKTEWLGLSKKVALSWEILDEYGDIAGFYIGRSNKFDGDYYHINSSVLPSQTRSFVDTTLNEYDNELYYVIGVVDTAGNGSISLIASVSIPDSIPPSAPTGLVGQVDTTGLVHIHWDMGKERDIYGYHIFSANDSTYTFNRLTSQPIQDTVYVDTTTLHTLTENIYYKVVAVDAKFNHSDFSRALELSRPDTIPPNASLFTDYEVREGAVYLSWAVSSSEDLLIQRLYRKQNQEEWELISTFDTNRHSYVDSLVEPGVWYEYLIESEDDAGQSSKSARSIKVRVRDELLMKGVQEFSAEIDKVNQVIELNWSDDAEALTGYKIYRSQNEGPFILIYSEKGQFNNYKDEKIRLGNTYTYLIQSIHKGNQVSQFHQKKVSYD